MATFRKRSNNWQARIQRKGYPDLTKSFSTKADAIAWARHIEAELDKGFFIDSTEANRTTLKELLIRYLSEITPNKKGAVNETYRIRTWINDPLSSRFMSSIRGTDIALWRDNRIANGISPNTIRLDLAILANLFNIAKTEWGFESLTNPVKLIKLPKLPQGRTRRLDENELVRLLDALNETHEIKAICLLAIETGMRRSELLKIEWQHIYLDNKFLLLPDTKNGHARTVPLSSKAIEIIHGLNTSSGNLFSTKTQSVSQAFYRACKRAGIKDLRFHDLRHEATSRFFEIGLNTMEVASITGHKTLSCLKRYTHLRATDLAQKLG